MIKSKAIDIIRALDSKEFKAFGKFVSSPYYNSDKKIIELYSLLKIHYPRFSNKDFTKENVYLRLFPGKKFNDGTVRKLLSRLQSLAENYLSHKSLDSSYSFYKKLFLLNSLYEKRLDKSFILHLNEINKIYKQKNNYDESFFNYNYELEVTNLNFYLSKGQAGFEPAKTMDDLLRCSVYIICYSLIIILKLNQDIIATGISYDFNYKNTIAFQFVELLGGNNFLELVKESAPDFYAIVAIYYYAFLIASQRDSDDRYYFEMKNLIVRNTDSFSRIEQYNLILLLENCSDDKIRKGKDFRNELHEVHSLMLSNNLYSWKSTDYFPLVGFRKMIKNALILNKFEWTSGFIEKYLKKLPPEFKDTMSYFSLALMSFHMKKYDEALKNISKVKFEFFSMKFDVWVLKLQSEFELGYFEEARYSIDSYRHLLKSDRSSPGWMNKRFLNFLNYYSRILKVLNGEGDSGKMERTSLRKEILSCSELLEKQWLIEKCDDIK